MYPQEFLYTKEHEWIRVDEEIGTIGITDYAQKELGDVVFVELPKVGEHITANESFGTIESVKAVSEIFAPVDGEVVGVNAKLQNSPEILNTDPHGDAWPPDADEGVRVQGSTAARAVGLQGIRGCAA